jgi:ABC-2 type transport system ATP-binding protein
MSKEVSVVVRQLSKTYSTGNAPALKALDLDISNGEIFGFLGPNGAGKTTFFSILCGLFSPSSGNVSVHGLDIKKDLEAVKRIIGVVPQDIALYNSLSGRDNLLYIGRMYGVKGMELKKKVDDYLTFFEFGENRNKAVKTYSGGMKRKINLIGGLLHDPEILLLDEPTVGMDVQTRSAIMEYLKALNKDKKMTIIYTSHYLEQAELFCNRIAIIDQGEILRLGQPKELIKQENQRNLEELFLSLTGRKILD